MQSDLTCHESIRTLAVRTRQCPQMLLTPADLDELLPLVRYQDQLAHFRKVPCCAGAHAASRNCGAQPCGLASR